MNSRLSKTPIHFPHGKASLLSSNPILIVKILVILVSTAVFYHNSLSLIFSNALEFTTGNITNYILTVPFLSAFIIYRKRSILNATTAMASMNSSRSGLRLDDVLGMTVFIIAILLFIASSNSLFALEYQILTIPLFLSGSIMLLFDIKTLRHCIVAILLLVYLQPPPGEVVSELAADLSWTSAVLVEGMLQSFQIPVSLDSSFGSPALVLTASSGSKVPFFVGEPSSGVFSTIGLSLFALFVAYIVRGPISRRLLLFACGFPIFYLLNAARIAIVITLWHLWGKDVSEAYHLVSGTLMVAIGTLVILIFAERILRLRIGSSRRNHGPCAGCERSRAGKEPICLLCGRVLSKIRQTFGTGNIERIALVIFVMSSATAAVSTPAAASDNSNNDPEKRISDLDIKTIQGKEATEYFFPQISGWDREFAYRDSRIESILNQDAALAYRYSPATNVVKLNDDKPSIQLQAKPIIFTSVQISTGHHVWEESLVSYPSRVGRPGATIIESTDIAISGDGQARFLLFNRLGSDSTEAVIYWFERLPLKFGSDFENRNILVSIWSNTDSLVNSGAISAPDASEEIKELYLLLAKPIKEHWTRQSSTVFNNEVFSSFISNNIQVLMILIVVPSVLFWLSYRKKQSTLSLRKYNEYRRLQSEDRIFLDALLPNAGGSGHRTGRSISQIYENMSGKHLKDDELIRALRVARTTGLIRNEVSSVNDEPMIVWRLAFRKKIVLDIS